MALDAPAGLQSLWLPCLVFVFVSLHLATCGVGPASYSPLETQPPCLPKSLSRSLPYIPAHYLNALCSPYLAHRL